MLDERAALQVQQGVPDADDVPGPDCRLADPAAVDERPVPAAEVDDPPLGPGLAQLRVPAGDERVGEHHVTLGRAADDDRRRPDRMQRRSLAFPPGPGCCRPGRWDVARPACRGRRRGRCLLW